MVSVAPVDSDARHFPALPEMTYRPGAVPPIRLSWALSKMRTPSPLGMADAPQ